MKSRKLVASVALRPMFVICWFGGTRCRVASEEGTRLADGDYPVTSSPFKAWPWTLTTMGSPGYDRYIISSTYQGGSRNY